MPLDDLALRLQRLLDRLVRRLHLGRPAAAAAPPPPGPRGHAAFGVERPDRRPLALRARAGARRSHRAVPREASPAAWLAPDADERRPADLDAGLPDVGHVRRAAGHPRIPLPRQAPPERRLLPARARRPAGGGCAGTAPPPHPRGGHRPRAWLYRPCRPGPPPLCR